MSRPTAIVSVCAGRWIMTARVAGAIAMTVMIATIGATACVLHAPTAMAAWTASGWMTAMPGADRNCARSEEHTSELQSLMRISYAVFCLKKKKIKETKVQTTLTKNSHNNRDHKI